MTTFGKYDQPFDNRKTDWNHKAYNENSLVEVDNYKCLGSMWVRSGQVESHMARQKAEYERTHDEHGNKLPSAEKTNTLIIGA